MQGRATVMMHLDDKTMGEASQWAGAFLAGFTSSPIRRAYRRDLACWFSFCVAHQLHPFRGVRRTHLELYLCALEVQDPPPAPGTVYRRVATLSSWFRWLEDGQRQLPRRVHPRLRADPTGLVDHRVDHIRRAAHQPADLRGQLRCS